MNDVTLHRVDALECRFVQHDWPFARERVADIEANWQARLATGQKLWNGRVLVSLDARVVERDGKRIFLADHFEVDYAPFLGHRDLGFPDPRVKNCFAMAALRSSDGAFLVARMGMHTANPGQLYFAAGTPDPGDVVGDRVDLAGSILRELAEETGITADDVVLSSGYTIAFESGRIACLQEARTHADAETLIARVKEFLAKEKAPEINGLVSIRSEADFAKGPMPPFLPVYLRDRLRNG